MRTVDYKAHRREAEKKFEKLLTLLRNLGKTGVAYSGGVDSTFLLAAAKQAPVEHLVALTMNRPYFAQWELEEASSFAEKLKVVHKIIEIPIDETIRSNPFDRCYHCKSITYKSFWEEMERLGYEILLDGTIADDTGEYRPGLRAVKEQRVRSPLREIGLTKSEIRQLSKEMGLPVWNKPSNTCLITRFPYNTRVSDEELRQVEKAERFLMDEGFRQVRVRKHGDIARIEVDPAKIATLVESNFINKIVPYVKSLGFEYVTVDMVGYKTGSMDFEILNNTTAAK